MTSITPYPTAGFDVVQSSGPGFLIDGLNQLLTIHPDFKLWDRFSAAWPTALNEISGRLYLSEFRNEIKPTKVKPCGSVSSYPSLYDPAKFINFGSNPILFLTDLVAKTFPILTKCSSQLIERILTTKRISAAGPILSQPVPEDDPALQVLDILDKYEFVFFSFFQSTELFGDLFSELRTYALDNTLAGWVRDEISLVALMYITLILQLCCCAIPAKAIFDKADGMAGTELGAIKLGIDIPMADFVDDSLHPTTTLGNVTCPSGQKPVDRARKLLASGLANSPNFQMPFKFTLPNYFNELWKFFGIDTRNRQNYGISTDSEGATEIVQFINLPYSELSKEQNAWSTNADKYQLGVGSHFTNASATGSISPVTPQWPLILNSDLYTPSSEGKNVIYHSDPLSQLCLFVATSIYNRIGSYLVPTSQLTTQPPGPPVIPHIGAACLEFGGHHPPHCTHRSGFEIDVSNVSRSDQASPHIRKLDDPKIDKLPKFEFGKNFFIAINPKEKRGRDHFTGFNEKIFDWYGHPAYTDKQQTIATVRGLCLSILLSGATQLMFADPWVFADCYVRLRESFATWRKLYPQVTQLSRISGVGEDKNYIASPCTPTLLLNHNDHFHARFVLRDHVLRDNGSDCRYLGALQDDADFLLKWWPVWVGLGIKQKDLLDFLDKFNQDPNGAKGSSQFHSTVVQCRINSVRKSVQDIGNYLSQFEISSLFDTLLKLVFDGDSDGDRKLLKNHLAETN